MVRRIVLSAALASMGALVIGGAVSAHIDPDPTQAQAGARLTVGFTVEHGCEGSPTVRLDMRLPDGVVDPVPESADGWEGSIDSVDGETIVMFAGGPLADDVEGTFSVTMTVPPTPDTTIYFPFVQRCDVGEIRWIGIPSEPGDALDEPAPAMELTGPVASAPATEPTAPAATAPAATEPVVTAAPTDPQVTDPQVTDPQVTDPQVTDPQVTDPQVTGPNSQTSAAPGTSEPVLISTAGDETGDSGTGTIVFIVSIAAVLGLAGFVVFRSRQARAGAAPDAR